MEELIYKLETIMHIKDAISSMYNETEKINVYH